MKEPHDSSKIGEVVEKARHAGHGDTIMIGDVLSMLGSSSFAPALLMVSLLIVTPLSGIPGLSSISGMIIALISLQLLVGREHLWLPGFVKRRKINREKFDNALSWLERPVGWLDKIAANRLTFLTKRPVSYLTYLTCLLIGSAMPFLELVPFTSSLLAFAVALLSVGLIARDGVFTVVATVYLLLIGLFVTSLAHTIFT